ncbi:MAG TPA: carboxylesterase family protein [Acidobacteriota bacterium]|nr:carboxylesterase family protein [Acidobacteriota bacterium]
MMGCKRRLEGSIGLLLLFGTVCGYFGAGRLQSETPSSEDASVGDVALLSGMESLGATDALSELKDRVMRLSSISFQDADRWREQKQFLLSTVDHAAAALGSGKYEEALSRLSAVFEGTAKQTLAEDQLEKLSESVTLARKAVANAAMTTVEIGGGRVAGAAGYKDTWVWKGIPYARPPVGEFRWRAPQDPLPWEGVRHSSDGYDVCSQEEHSKLWVPTGRVVGSEDCLYLTVWRPRTKEQNLPVYFWIHGGGNNFGTNKLYEGSFLASRSNMVVVTIQYRLGVMGWFHHPALKREGTPEEGSGNFGMLDIVKALTWVRENIKAFGGDPGNVIVAGQSAGAHNTLNLIVSPLSAGLFHKAVCESGGMQPISGQDGVKKAEQTTENLLINEGRVKGRDEAVDRLGKMSSDEIVAYLRSKTPAELIRAESVNKIQLGTHLAFIDGTVIPGPYLDVISSGEYNKVPIVLGSNEYELKPFQPLVGGIIPTSSGHTWSDLHRVLEGRLRLDEVLADPLDKERYEACGYYGSRNWKARYVDSIARRLKQVQDNVWTYLFKWGGVGSGPAPYDFVIGPGHATELPFFFGWPYDTFGYAFTEENRAGREALQNAVMAYIAQFARMGDPGKGDGTLPHWQAWSNDGGGPKCLVLDGTFAERRISMMTEEVTVEAVQDEVERLTPRIKALVKLWIR